MCVAGGGECTDQQQVRRSHWRTVEDSIEKRATPSYTRGVVGVLTKILHFSVHQTLKGPQRSWRRLLSPRTFCVLSQIRFWLIEHGDQAGGFWIFGFVCVCVWVLSKEASCCLPTQLRFMTIDQAMYWIYGSTKYIDKPFITVGSPCETLNPAVGCLPTICILATLKFWNFS